MADYTEADRLPSGGNRTLVVTAVDDRFMPLAKGLVESLQQWSPRPYSDIACFDLGLSANNREWLARYAAHIVAPGWDLPVAEAERSAHAEWRALTVRPFLPRYFPGYDLYLWIDADAWVQERFALDWYIAVAGRGQLAITPEIDRAYRLTPGHIQWRVSRMQGCFGPEAARRALWDRYFNAGVFALPGNAPHWARWEAWFRQGLVASQGVVCCDQSALNQAIWIENLPVGPLPALCNWLCHLATPAFNLRHNRFCEPALPSMPLGILHLAADSKHLTLTPVGNATAQPITLRYPGSGIAGGTP